MPINIEILKTRLPNAVTLQVYDEVDSTNTVAKTAALAGAKHGTLVIAERQSKGRGRMTRSFFSPTGTGIYMSLILHPQPDFSPLQITTAAAVAVAEAIESISSESTMIKWVNDVYLRNKKVCGILAEGVYTGSVLSHVILGIGINVFEPKNGFPVEIKDRAGSIFGPSDVFERWVREQLAAAVISRFWGIYEALPQVEYLSAYRSRDMLCGRQIQVLDLNGEVLETAKAIGIGDACELMIETEQQQVKYLSSGEVSVRL